MKERKGKVMVGMSGGVDSSVAALLLLEQGWEVVGVTFRLWSPEELGMGASSCCSVDDVNDARLVCDTLGIPHYVINYKELFREAVVEDFAQSYARGETPNPCIQCNRHIKFGAFVTKARSMGFDHIATGHYASVLYDENLGRWRLRRGAHARKDQSYVLYPLTQDQLSATCMPLGEYAKEEIRTLAAKNNLIVSAKADSQDICFVPDGDYAAFLEAYTGRAGAPGDFLDMDGKVLGRHQGIQRYTVGQRKGLGIALGKPMFVAAIDPAANTVTLAEDAALWTRELTAGALNWIDWERLDGPREVQAQIRYNHTPQDAVVTPLEGGLARVAFRQPQRAPTKGQAVVLYQGDYVAGGGTIR